MNVFCPKCGTASQSESKFCRECATPLPATPPPGATLPLPPMGPGASLSAAGISPADYAPGSMFAGRFQIIEALGGGGMGRVYKALDTKIGEKVALKIIKPELAADPDIAARFTDEIRLARRIAHPNVCRTFDIGEAAGTPFISMEYVAGEELKNIIRMTKSLSPGQTAQIGKQIAAGLAEAHRLGIVHRDLKPQNIMIDREGSARIMDFGLACLSQSDHSRTGRGVMIGTPDYMSPEQAEGGEIDARSDIYSVGVMLFEMATGRLPFEAATAVGMAVKHKAEPPPDPRSVNPRIPDDLARLILRCLEKSPAGRWQKAADLREELERIEKDVPATSPIVSKKAPSTARAVARSGSRSMKWIIPAAAIAVVAVGILLVSRLFRKPGAAVPKIPGSIAVVGFENQTGDPKFDHLRKAIPELIITNLENMGRFQVTTWERMQDVLKQAGRGIVEVIGPEDGFEICRKEGVSAIVTGSFTKAGDTFATNVKLLDADSRKLLKSASSRGDGEDSILRSQIDELSGEIVGGLAPAGAPSAGGSPAVSVADVTTKSMEAYAAFLEGRDAYERYRYNDAAAVLERSVALDPAFATAHYYLARIYRNMGDLKRTVEHFESALANSGKASEKERLWIQAGYAGYVERSPERQIGILSGAVKSFPREKTVWLDLGNALNADRRYDEAVVAYRKALELDPAYGGALNQMAYCYLEMGRHDEALEALRTYSKFYPEDVNPVDSMAEVEYNRGRLAEAEAGYRKVVAADPNFGAEYRLAWMQALQERYGDALDTLRAWAGRAATEVDKFGSRLLEGTLLHLVGRERESRDALRLARELGVASGTTVGVELVEAWLAFDRKDWAGTRAALRRMTAVTSAASSNRIVLPVDPALIEAVVDVAEGKIEAARESWTASEKARILNANYEQLVEIDLRNLVNGRILFAEGDLEGARAILAREHAVPLMFMNALDLIAYICPLEWDDLARIYAGRADWDGAIAQYEILTSIGPGHKNRRPVHPIYRYRLAQAYEKKGLRAEAAAEYGLFLKILEKADTISPEMAQARARLAALGAKRP